MIHQLTAIPPRIDPRKLTRDFALTDRLRTEGTRHLLAAARASGVSRIIAQSIAFAYAPGPPGTVHVEDDPAHRRTLPRQFRRSARGGRRARARGPRRRRAGAPLRLLLRPRHGDLAPAARSARTSPAAGCRSSARGHGVWSFIHIEDAARATVTALTDGEPGAYNIVDDEPRSSRVAPRTRQARSGRAAATRPRVARAAARGGVRRDDHDARPGRLQRACQGASSAGRRATRAGARAFRARSAEGRRGRYLRTTSSTPAASSTRPAIRCTPIA